MLTVGRGRGLKVPSLSTGLFPKWLISSEAKHPIGVMGHVGSKVEDGEHSFADVRR